MSVTLGFVAQSLIKSALSSPKYVSCICELEQAAVVL